MSLTHEDYAYLANDAYCLRKKDDIVIFNAVEYRILEYSEDEETSYKGTIYQCVKTGNIIVAHRGTERSSKDISVDYEMVTNFTNPQIPHALTLVKRALKIAHSYARRQKCALPEISITGHSLGGALAEVSAFEYDLKAETFNGYGSCDLTYFTLDNIQKRIPASDTDKVINHAMAGDIVSAVNAHFGRVITYIREAELEALKYWNYGKEETHYYEMWCAVISQTIKYNAHGVTNFIDVETYSVLSDTSAKVLADQEEGIIAAYRQDLYRNRQIIIEKVNHLIGKVRKLARPLK